MKSSTATAADHPVALPAPDESLPVAALLRAATRRLEDAGCDTPRLDAELLLASVLGVERAGLVTGAEGSVPPAAAERFETLFRRREAREPVAYVLGRRAFRHLELAVDRRVLIPRPETELLVEVGLDLPGGTRVVEVGTGSGAVALALKHERPDLQVTGTDLSPQALTVARANARRLGLDVRFVAGDLLERLPGPVDAVVANLPYVAERDRASLPPEVADHEPPLALMAGDDGLAIIRRLAVQASSVPFVALEVGAGQAGAVRDLLADQGRRTRVERDLAGIDRVVVGWAA